VSECCLSEQFISENKVIFDGMMMMMYDNICFVLDQHTQLDIDSIRNTHCRTY